MKRKNTATTRAARGPSPGSGHTNLSEVVSRAPRSVPALEIYDTTLRDGAQAEDVSFSAEDKVRVTQKLDELGVLYIEGGWPGANPRDVEFFRMI